MLNFFLLGIQYVICKGCLNFHFNIYPNSLILCSDDLYLKVSTTSDVDLIEVKEQVQIIIETAINNMFDMFTIDCSNTKYVLNSNF